MKKILLIITAFLLAFTSIKAQYGDYLNINSYNTHHAYVHANSMWHWYSHGFNYNYFGDWRTTPYVIYEKTLINEDSTEVIEVTHVEINIIPQVYYRNHYYSYYNPYRNYYNPYYFRYKTPYYYNSWKYDKNYKKNVVRKHRDVRITDGKKILDKSKREIAVRTKPIRKRNSSYTQSKTNQYVKQRSSYNRSPYNKLLKSNTRKITPRRVTTPRKVTPNTRTRTSNVHKTNIQHKTRGSGTRTQSKSTRTNIRKRNEPKMEDWMFEPLNL